MNSLFRFAVCFALLYIGATMAIDNSDVDTDLEDLIQNVLVSQDENVVREQTGMKVTFAYYGLSCANGYLRNNVKDLSMDWAGHLCDGRSWCSGTVTNGNLRSDPYRGCPKDFVVVAKCSDGRIISDSVKAVGGEGEKFYLSCNYKYN